MIAIVDCVPDKDAGFRPSGWPDEEAGGIRCGAPIAFTARKSSVCEIEDPERAFEIFTSAILAD